VKATADDLKRLTIVPATKSHAYVDERMILSGGHLCPLLAEKGHGVSFNSFLSATALSTRFVSSEYRYLKQISDLHLDEHKVPRGDELDHR
jgi:hypothetical protein